jgi:hypothetical protein
MKGTIDEVLEEVKGSGKKKDQPKDEDEETGNEQRATDNGEESEPEDSE